jgi:hypothetical protein
MLASGWIDNEGNAGRRHSEEQDQSVPGVATTSITNSLAGTSLRQRRADAFRSVFCAESAATDETRRDMDLPLWTYTR